VATSDTTRGSTAVEGTCLTTTNHAVAVTPWTHLTRYTASWFATGYTATDANGTAMTPETLDVTAANPLGRFVAQSLRTSPPAPLGGSLAAASTTFSSSTGGTNNVFVYEYSSIPTNWPFATAGVTLTGKAPNNALEACYSGTLKVATDAGVNQPPLTPQYNGCEATNVAKSFTAPICPTIQPINGLSLSLLLSPCLCGYLLKADWSDNHRHSNIKSNTLLLLLLLLLLRRCRIAWWVKKCNRAELDLIAKHRAAVRSKGSCTSCE
jgi:hypothetical protein